MNTHEMAMKTYEALQKRKRNRELKKENDIIAVDCNRYRKHNRKKYRTYYSQKHTL